MSKCCFKIFFINGMSNKKTIQINPDLFSISPKKRGRQSTPNVNATKKQEKIRPNSLKRKLIQRVKEHKLKETKDQEINQKMAQEIISKEKDSKYAEEFNDSINYLNQLSNQKKDLLKQKRKSFTLKNPISAQQPDKSLKFDFQDDLSEVPPIPNIPENEAFISLNPPVQSKIQQTSVPYGCLKGGNKPTYKSWMKTQKNPISYSSESSLSTTPPAPLNIEQGISEREKKLSQLKDKIRKTNEREVIEQQYFNDNILITPNSRINTENLIENSKTQNLPISDVPKKIKKTTKRSYSLGKNKQKKSIGVLIKDRKTRKKVIDAQKELKRKNINDVKQYLRDHGLIKAGSKAPNDIMRKMYESSMLSGDITNQDNDVLMHNFLNEND